MASENIKVALQNITEPLQPIRTFLNKILPSEPLVLVAGTATVCYVVVKCIDRIPNDGVAAGMKRYIFKTARCIPAIRNRIETEIAATEKSISDDIRKLFTRKGDSEPHFVCKLPSKGIEADQILSQLQEYLNLGTYTWENGQVSGTVYHGGQELTELNTKVFSLAAWTNPLHADVFPGICKMEGEVVRICCDLFHGGEGSCGSVTSGGTESIILAVKAYRDYAIKVRGIRHPEILLPATAHAAFDKAAELLNMKIRKVAFDPTTMQTTAKSMQRMITRNTCMMVASSPAFPHGCIDDVKNIAALGLKYNIPVHVDACLGGFLLVFMPAAGFEVPPFDFRVSGVTSISADTHKYGYAPKGSSVLLFSDKKYRHQQYFLQPNWAGGIYASPTLAGSRPGVTIAGCWSSLLYFGMEGYVKITRDIITATRKIHAGLRTIDGVFVYGEPQVSVIALGSDAFDIYKLADTLNKKGWSLNNLQFPSSVHICCTYRHTLPGVVEQFLGDVKEAADILKLDPDNAPKGSAALYASSQQIPDRSLVGDIMSIYIDSLYATSNSDADNLNFKPITNGKANDKKSNVNQGVVKPVPSRKTGAAGAGGDRN